MRKSFTLAMAAVAFNLLVPAVSHANCAASGTIPRVFVQVGALTHIGVRDNANNTVFFDFTTTNTAVISAAIATEASHMTVQIVGSASSCGAVVNGLSAGGNVVAMLVSP
jgi:hypothetical protein